MVASGRGPTRYRRRGAYVDETQRLRPGDLLALMDLTDALLRLERSRRGEGLGMAPIRAPDARIARVLDDPGDLVVTLDRAREAVPDDRRYLHLYPSYDKIERLAEKTA